MTTQTKNEKTMLWSTSPTGRKNRGESMKKDIAKIPIVRRKSKIFRGYNKTIVPPDQTYSSKVHLEPRNGRFVAEL